MFYLTTRTIGFDAGHRMAEYEQVLPLKDKKIDYLHRQLGKRTAEVQWASKKLTNLDFDTKQPLLKFE